MSPVSPKGSAEAVRISRRTPRLPQPDHWLVRIRRWIMGAVLPVSGGVMGDVTVLVQKAAAGDRSAFDAAYAEILGELKALARRRFQAQPGCTLSATMLVNEAWIKLAGGVRATDRAHFFRIAAQAMRQIWIDRIRSRESEAERIQLYAGRSAEGADSPEQWIELLDWERAMGELGQTDPELAELVDLHVFTGLELDEIAELKGCSLRTVQRQWRSARAFLRAS